MIDKEKLLIAFKQDLEESKKLRQELDSKIAVWKKEYNAEPYGNEIEGKSSIVSRDIKKQSEWQHCTLIEPFVSSPDIIKTTPVTFEDVRRSKVVELVLNTQFCRQFPRYNFLTKALKVLDQEGTLVVRTGWEYEEKEVEVEEIISIPNPQVEQLKQALLANQTNPEAVEQIQMQIQQLPPIVQIPRLVNKVLPVVNQPTAMVCRNEDVFIDPTCQDDMSKCQFVIHRYESDLTTLKQTGLYKNLDKVSLSLEKENNDLDYKTPDKTEFKFKDKARKKLLVYEYWGKYDINNDGIAEDIVCAWINNTIIRLEDNPYPDKKVPFIVLPFSSVPFSLYGESNAEYLSDTQKIKSAIFRGFIDNMALSNNGQKGIKKGALDYHNKKRFLKGDNFEFNGSQNDFYDGSFNELPASIFNILQLMNNEAESITGVASFNSGLVSTSLGETATGIRGVLDSASTRRLNIVRNISENLVKPLLRKWLAYNTEFLDEGTQFRITNEEFLRLKKEDLEAKVDIDITISTSDDNQAKAHELAFLLQTLAPSEDPNIRRAIMAKIASLHKMPDLAKSIEEYQPQHDPFTEQLQQLQLQLLEAQVANERAKAGENEVDKSLKGAKVQTELAKAKNLNSTAEKLDLDFLQQYHRTKEKDQERKDNRKYNYDITKEQLKLLQNMQGKNL